MNCFLYSNYFLWGLGIYNIAIKEQFLATKPGMSRSPPVWYSLFDKLTSLKSINY